MQGIEKPAELDSLLPLVNSSFLCYIRRYLAKVNRIMNSSPYSDWTNKFVGRRFSRCARFGTGVKMGPVTSAANDCFSGLQILIEKREKARGKESHEALTSQHRDIHSGSF